MKERKFSMEAANNQRKKSEKYLRTGLLKWKPRFKKAGDGFCQAAILYCEAGDLQGGVEMLVKASESYKCKRMWTSGAKTLEHAINLAIDNGDVNTIYDLAWKSAALYKKAGHPDSSSQVLERAGQALKQTNPDKNLLLLEKAAETVETENRPLQAAFYGKKLLLIALETQDFPYAISKTRQLIQLYQESGQTLQTGNYVLLLVIINLILEDIEKAYLSASEFHNFCSDCQSHTIDDLLEGFEASDHSKVSKGLNSESVVALRPVFEDLIQRLWTLANKFKVVEIQEKNVSEVSKDPNNTSIIEESAQPNPISIKERSLAALGLNLPKFQASQFHPVVKKPAILKKRATIASMNGSISSKLEFGGVAESAKKNALSRVHSVGPFVDIIGIDVVTPSQLGMTTDQWREMKKSVMNDIPENDFDSC